MNRPTLPPFDEETQRILVDQYGKRFLSIGMSKKTRTRKDGGRKQTKRFYSLETVDGHLWHPSDDTRLVRCTPCVKGDSGWFRATEPPTHGLCTAEAARRCGRCGCHACPRHSRLLENEWLCRDCARHGSLGRWLRAIFCTPEEDS